MCWKFITITFLKELCHKIYQNLDIGHYHQTKWNIKIITKRLSALSKAVE